MRDDDNGKPQGRTTAREDLAKKLIQLAEGGVVGWQGGWRLIARNRPLNALSGRAYSGGNQINLRLNAGLDGAWHSPGWLTAHQIRELGGSLREGEQANPRVVEFWKTTEFWERRKVNLMPFIDGRLGRVMGVDERGVMVRKDGDAEPVFIPLPESDDRIAIRQNVAGLNARRLTFTQARNENASLTCVNYLVYNLEQCEGISSQKLHSSLRVDAVENAEWRAQLQGLSDMTAVLEGRDSVAVQLSTDPKDALSRTGDLKSRVDALIAGMEANGLKVVHTVTNQPRYSIRSDTVFMPEPGQFKTPHAYVATLVHELAHATGAGHRLGRFVGGVWGGESDVTENDVTASRAKEEMIAEIASALACSEIGANYEMTTTAGYLQSWMGVLKDGPSVAYAAAKDAQNAADFLVRAMGKQLALSARAFQDSRAETEASPQSLASDESSDFEMQP